jgi:hypothetical protein
MENRVLITWQARDEATPKKESAWYWTVGIVSIGVTIAALIIQNYLFALICLLAGFTIMIVGSRAPKRHTYTLTDKGFMIGRELIPYHSIRKFAIFEHDPMKLTIETTSIVGSLTAPLHDVDHRAIRTELLNRNIDEVESLDFYVERVARAIGLSH